MNLLTAVGRGLRDANPFDRGAGASLMAFSPLGSLRCQCEPSDAAQPGDDRRRSCRACGNAMVMTNPDRLYIRLSRREIRTLVGRIRRATFDPGLLADTPIDSPIDNPIDSPIATRYMDVAMRITDLA